jgi:hypothetical protein
MHKHIHLLCTRSLVHLATSTQLQPCCTYEFVRLRAIFFSENKIAYQLQQISAATTL